MIYTQRGGNNDNFIIYKIDDLETNTRNNGIDLLKLILSVLIILIHIPTEVEPQLYTFYIKPALTRFAVPCFFIISGWFLYGERIREKSLKSLKKILPVTIVTTIIYYYVFGSQELHKWDFVNLVLYNATDNFGFHLWYLYAYIYLLIAAIILGKTGFDKILWCIPVFLVVEIIFGKYSMVFWGNVYPSIYCRNFLITGLPYLLIGGTLRKFENRLPRTCFKASIVVIFLLMCMSITEKMILRSFNLEAPRECYLATPLLAVSVFLLFKDFSVRKNLFSLIGNKYSLWIYIVHPAILKVIV